MERDIRGTDIVELKALYAANAVDCLATALFWLFFSETSYQEILLYFHHETG